MRRIRRIEPEETDEFLVILCTAFDLDLRRASDLFVRDPLYDLKGKWALFEGGKMLSVLTTTPLRFGWGAAQGIAGVATLADRRGEGLAGQLLDHVLDAQAEPAMLFARREDLYVAHGFRTSERVLRARIEVDDEARPEALEDSEVRTQYDVWAEGSEDRLRRDDRRWEYWRWHCRTCVRWGDGYVCQEGNTLREVLGSGAGPLPLPAPTDWYGLESILHSLDLPLAGEPQQEMALMVRGAPRAPRLFMTDQF